MKNGFGLKYLHRFFNIPFLQLQVTHTHTHVRRHLLRTPQAWRCFLCVQRETLLRQLETNQLDMDATLEELSVQQETEDQNYDMCGLFPSQI